MLKKKLNAKHYAELLFSENKNLLKGLRVTREASPLAVVSATTLAVFRLFLLIPQIVLEKKNSQFFEKILKEYERMLKRWYLGKDIALVKTAVPLTSKEEEELNEKLAAIFGRYLRLEMEIDPQLIGGMVIKVGDKTIDRSLLGKLNKLEEYIRS